MTFTVKIALQPFEVAFEAGSISEAVAILQEPDNELSKLAALACGVDQGEEVAETTTTAPAPVKKERKKRGAVEAVAPAPIPVPDAAPPAPTVPVAPVDTGIPAFLDRTAPVAVAPPPAPVAPPPVVPAAPVSPPVGVLAGKVVAELKRRGDGAADQGKGLVDWLAKASLCVPGCSFVEACDCVAFLSDEKVKPVADALNVA